MRLLISAELFYPSRLGGPANTLYWLSKGLVKKGVEVSVLTTDSFIEEGGVETDCWKLLDGIRIRYCHTNKHFPLKMLWHSWKEVGICDRLMLCDMFQRQVLLTAFMAKLRKKPIIWSPRGELFPSALANNCVKRWYLYIVKRLFVNTATFHATSKEEEIVIKKIFGDSARIQIVPNYMELPDKQPHEDQNPPYFLYLGRIAPIKALDRLIDGFALSRRFVESNYILKLAGGVEDQFRDYYQQLVEQVERVGLRGKVEFVGPVNGKEKFKTYADAYAMFLVSHSENFGNVVIESLSQGTPVVASKGTPWERLEEYDAGFWIENSPECIAKCVDKLLSLSENEYELLRRGAVKFGETFDINKNIDKWIKVLQNAS